MDYLENRKKQVLECVKNNSDTYAIFSCPKEYEKLVLEELERHNIGKSPVPTTNNIKTAEYVISRVLSLISIIGQIGFIVAAFL